RLHRGAAGQEALQYLHAEHPPGEAERADAGRRPGEKAREAFEPGDDLRVELPGAGHVGGGRCGGILVRWACAAGPARARPRRLARWEIAGGDPFSLCGSRRGVNPTLRHVKSTTRPLAHLTARTGGASSRHFLLLDVPPVE